MATIFFRWWRRRRLQRFFGTPTATVTAFLLADSTHLLNNTALFQIHIKLLRSVPASRIIKRHLTASNGKILVDIIKGSTVIVFPGRPQKIVVSRSHSRIVNIFVEKVGIGIRTASGCGVTLVVLVYIRACSASRSTSASSSTHTFRSHANATRQSFRNTLSPANTLPKTVAATGIVHGPTRITSNIILVGFTKVVSMLLLFSSSASAPTTTAGTMTLVLLLLMLLLRLMVPLP